METSNCIDYIQKEFYQEEILAILLNRSHPLVIIKLCYYTLASHENSVIDSFFTAQQNHL